MNYIKKDLVKSYLAAERYQSWSNAEALVKDTQAFTASLQEAFGVSYSELLSTHFFQNHGPLAMVFRRTVQAFRAQEDGMLEESLLYLKLEAMGSIGQSIIEEYVQIGRTREQVQQHAQTLLLDITNVVWPDTPQEVTSEDLLRLGFDDRNRPDPMDYW